MTTRPGGAVLATILSVVIVGCAQSQPSTTPPVPSSATDPLASSSTDRVPANTTGPDRTPGSSPAVPPADLAPVETKLREEDRTRAGLANLGPGATELAALMDQRGSFILGEAGRAMSAHTAIGAAKAPNAILMSAPAPGSTIIGPFALATNVFDTLLSDGPSNTRPLDDRPAIVSDDGSNSQTGTLTEARHGCGPDKMCAGPVKEDVTVAGSPGVISTDTVVSATYDASRVGLDVSITTSGEVHDAAGKMVFRIDSTGTAHMTGDVCPDASGIAKLHIEFTARENYFSAADPGGGSAGYGLEQHYQADVRVQADDGANLAGIDITSAAHETSKGGVKAAGASQSDLFAHDLDATGSVHFGSDPAAGYGPAVRGAQTATSADALSLGLWMGLFLEQPAKTGAKAAEKAWRSGMCIRVSATPTGGSVKANWITQVEVIVLDRYANKELDKPIEATFGGVKSLDPTGTTRHAPAVYKVTAGPAPGDRATANFRSVSNRGIGHTSASFVVAAPCQPDCRIEYTIGGPKVPMHHHGVKCGEPVGTWVIKAEGVWPPLGAGVSSTVAKETMTFTIPAGGLPGRLTGSLTTRWTVTRVSNSGRVVSVEHNGTDTAYVGTASFLPNGTIKVDYTQKGTLTDNGKVRRFDHPDMHGYLIPETGTFC